MTIRHARGSYPIHFHSLREAVECLPERSVFITDENVGEAWGHLLPKRPCLVLPPGERTKCLETFAQCLSWLARNGATRSTTVVLLGGGVIGDLGGFVAASYMRGVSFAQIPTSLLAQVDSSVGGKVGVDLPEGKNLVGAFYPPVAVSVCMEVLLTLPQRQFTAGMAEVWKYGFIMDAELVDQLSRAPLAANSEELSGVVRRCIELKARVVEEDEFETTGRRAILNFGHTIGHSIETVTEYGPLLHGEAISIGMVLEARLGERLGVTPAGSSELIEARLAGQGLPVTHESLARQDELVDAMRRDKKARAGELSFSLLTDVGECKLVENVPEADVRAVLESR